MVVDAKTKRRHWLGIARQLIGVDYLMPNDDSPGSAVRQGAQKIAGLLDRLFLPPKTSSVLSPNLSRLHTAFGFGFRFERAIIDHSGGCAGWLAIDDRALLGCGIADNIEVSERRLRESGDRKE